METITVNATRSFALLSFLADQGFDVEVLTEDVVRVSREGDLPVFVSHNDGALYFESDLGNVSEIESSTLLRGLLDLNTEILPVSIGFNTTNVEDPRLVLVESRVTGDLSDQEILSVFNALSIASDKAEALLSTHLS